MQEFLLLVDFVDIIVVKIQALQKFLTPNLAAAVKLVTCQGEHTVHLFVGTWPVVEILSSQ